MSSKAAKILSRLGLEPKIRERNPILMNFRRITSTLVAAAAIASLLLTLFFSWKGWIVGLLAFFVTAFILDWLAGRQQTHVMDAAPAWFWVTTAVLGFIVFLSIVTLFASSRSGGVCVTDDQPIFAKRDHYFLTNHGTKTEVSRSRFLAVGVSFEVGWHTMILLAALGGLRKRSRRNAPLLTEHRSQDQGPNRD
jgi:hypothetical protein